MRRSLIYSIAHANNAVNDRFSGKKVRPLLSSKAVVSSKPVKIKLTIFPLKWSVFRTICLLNRSFPLKRCPLNQSLPDI